MSQRDLTPDEARQLDAAIAVRIDDALAQADFASAPVPDFAVVTPDPHRVLADLNDMESRAQLGAHARAQLRETLAHFGQALDSKDQPADAGR